MKIPLQATRRVCGKRIPSRKATQRAREGVCGKRINPGQCPMRLVVALAGCGVVQALKRESVWC